jgi:hypothetical protein
MFEKDKYTATVRPPKSSRPIDVEVYASNRMDAFETLKNMYGSDAKIYFVSPARKKTVSPLVRVGTVIQAMRTRQAIMEIMVLGNMKPARIMLR